MLMITEENSFDGRKEDSQLTSLTPVLSIVFGFMKTEVNRAFLDNK